MKHYYIYMTTNNITGMKYIGKHYGELDDSYLGSGKKLKLDIDIYGKNSFQNLYIDSHIVVCDDKSCGVLCVNQQTQFYVLIFLS